MSSTRKLVSQPVRRVLRHYWQIAGVKWWHIAGPLALAVSIALIEGYSLAVLVPLGEGVAAGGFAALNSSRWFGWVTALLPAGVAASPSSDVYLALLLVGVLFAGRFLTLGLTFVHRQIVGRRDERYARMVRDETFGRVLGFGRQYFDRQALGHVDAELGWSVSSVTMLSAGESFVMGCIRLTMKMGIVVSISPVLFTMLLLSFVVIHLITRRVATVAAALAEEALEVHRRVRREVLDLLGSIPLVKAYRQEDRARTHHKQILLESEGIELRRRTLAYLNQPIEEGVVLMGALIAEAFILVGGSGSPTVELARFAVFFLVAQQCLPEVNTIVGTRLTLVAHLPQLEALAKLFENEGKFIVESGVRPWSGLQTAIEVRGLRFHYHPHTEVLRGVDAVFPARCVTAVVGPSGAGKTSLIDLIARLYDCPPHTIFVDGIDLREFDLRSLHKRFAVVSQDVWLLNRSVRDNLTFGLDAPVGDDQLFEVLDDVGLKSFFADQPRGLDTELGDRGVRLSGGQRQRVALARTLLREPEILILDEATSALDSLLERQALAAVDRRLKGRTIIVIAHRLSTLRNADQILVMDDGRVVETGTWDTLIARNGRFAELYRAQAGTESEVPVEQG